MVIYVENDALFTFKKIGQGASKTSFPLVYKKMRVMRINSCIEVVCIYLDYRWLPFRWLSLVISGYPWFCRRFLQMSGKIIANAPTISHILKSRDNQREPSETTGNYMESVGKSQKNIFGSAMEIIASATVFIKCRSVEIYLHLPGTIIARLKRFYRGNLTNFCKSKSV